MPGVFSRRNMVADSFLAYLSESIVTRNMFNHKLNVLINIPGLQTIFIERFIEINQNNTSRSDRIQRNGVFIP